MQPTINATYKETVQIPRSFTKEVRYWDTKSGMYKSAQVSNVEHHASHVYTLSGDADALAAYKELLGKETFSVPDILEDEIQIRLVPEGIEVISEIRAAQAELRRITDEYNKKIIRMKTEVSERRKV